MLQPVYFFILGASYNVARHYTALIIASSLEGGSVILGCTVKLHIISTFYCTLKRRKKKEKKKQTAPDPPPLSVIIEKTLRAVFSSLSTFY